MNEVKINDQPNSLKSEIVKLVDGLRYLKDIYDPNYLKYLRDLEKRSSQFTTAFTNSGEEITISWR